MPESIHIHGVLPREAVENETLTNAHTISITRKHSMHWVQQCASACDWVKYGKVTAHEYLMSVWVWFAESYVWQMHPKHGYPYCSFANGKYLHFGNWVKLLLYFFYPSQLGIHYLFYTQYHWDAHASSDSLHSFLIMYNCNGCMHALCCVILYHLSQHCSWIF